MSAGSAPMNASWCLQTYFGIAPAQHAGHYAGPVPTVLTGKMWRDLHPDGLSEYPVTFHWLAPGKHMYAYDYLSALADVVPL